MVQRNRKAIIRELEDRLSGLPNWQKTVTLETIDLMERKKLSNKEMYLNLSIAEHFDLANLFLPK